MAAKQQKHRSIWVKSPNQIFGIDSKKKPVGGLVLRDGKVAQILLPGESITTAVDEVIDARGLVVLPGLINTHHHFYQSLTRSMRDAIKRPLFPWLSTLYPVWAEQSAADIEIATRLVLAELLLSGCTTTTDHHYLFSANCTDPLDVQFQVAAEMGVRVILTRGSMSLGEDQGGLPPQTVVQGEADVLADCERLIARWHDPLPHAMNQVALAPCSPFSVTPALLRDSATLANRHNVGLHTHLAETEQETEYCLTKFGSRPLDHLEQNGWLNERTWFAHGVHFNSDEMQRISSAKAGIAHCPSSNMLLGSGLCRVDELREAGVAVGVGVDGSASNDHSNLIQELRQAYLLQRMINPDYSHKETLALATSGGAAILHRPELGHLNVGAAADIAMFSTNDLRFSGAQDPLAAIIISGAHTAYHVLVGGRWRVRKGELVDVDADQLMQRHGDAAKALWQRAGIS